MFIIHLLFGTHCTKPFRCYAKIILTYGVLYCVVPSDLFCIFVTPTSISYGKGNMASRWADCLRIILFVFSLSPPSSSVVEGFRSIFSHYLSHKSRAALYCLLFWPKYYILHKYRFASVVREFIAIERLNRENPIKTKKSKDFSPSFLYPYLV